MKRSAPLLIVTLLVGFIAGRGCSFSATPPAAPSAPVASQGQPRPSHDPKPLAKKPAPAKESPDDLGESAARRATELTLEITALMDRHQRGQVSTAAMLERLRAIDHELASLPSPGLPEDRRAVRPPADREFDPLEADR